MSTTNQTTVTLVGAGGSPPYSFLVVAGPGTTIPATLSGPALTVDATSLATGTYSVEIQITDHIGAISTKLIEIDVVNPATFSILNRDSAFQPTSLPFATTIPLLSTGGQGAVTWALLNSVTTLPGVTLTGSTLSFSLTAFGGWTVGVRATDSLGNTVTRLISVSVVSSTVVSVVDGHALLQVNATDAETGTHSFTLAVADATETIKKATFSYSVDAPVSNVDLPETVVDHFWADGDTTEVVIPIAGDLSGFSLGNTNAVVAGNGLTATIDTTTNSLVVTGPPTSFGNSEIEVSIAIVQGNTQVATITREFTLVSYQGTNNIGVMTCSTRPYIVGEVVGLNPERPYFNSPSIFKSAGLTVQLATNSTLPQGLSLDAVTGLIYGTVLDDDVTQSVLQYVDSTGSVQGTITVVWDIVVGQFQLIDNLTDGELQSPYSATISSSSSATLASVTLHRGTLPTGMAFGLSSDQTQVVLAGTPSEAGFYDVWIQVTNTNGQVAYLYKRLVFAYVTPLVILTDALQTLLTNVAFTQTLNATGGIQPYQWAVTSGTLPAGITLNPSSGVLSGTTAVAVYNSPITFQVTDERGVTASTVLTLLIDNTLRITTTVLPVIIPGTNYTYQLQAVGGQGAYTWTLGTGSGNLPGGFTLSPSGVLSGATSLSGFSSNIIFQVTDTANNTTTATFLFTIGEVFGLIIDTEGIGPFIRGAAYNGSLKVIGNGTAPYKWSVTPDTPDPLPGNFTLTADVSTQGITATLAGLTTASLLNDSVKIQVVDANGNSAFVFLLIDTFSSLSIATTALPQATVTGNYAFQLTASGFNPAFTWSMDATSPALPDGLTLTSAGVLQGVPTAVFDTVLVFRVTDILGDFSTKPLELVSKLSTLLITTTALPNAIAGLAYNFALTATGGAPGYNWSVSPNTANALPSGLSVDPGSGTILGTTFQAGYVKPITFRVTDSINVIREVTLVLTVLAGIKLFAGPDYIQNTTLGSLGICSGGDVTAIAPRPNLSFFIVATNCISTTAAGFGFGLPAGFAATCVAVGNVNLFIGSTEVSLTGAAVFALSGPFGSAGAGNHSLNFSVSDSGVNASATFQWTVFPQPQITLGPLTGSLPEVLS